MVLGYFLAQLLPWVRNKKGYLLVLGSANVDEALRGYFTKYDCSSADINPIGGISKKDLKKFLAWCADKDRSNVGYVTLKKILASVPTAELEPITENYVQNDERDMGMTYDELSTYGELRNIERAGPLSMYERLKQLWQTSKDTPSKISEKVKSFFFYYGVNRHKMTTLTPSYHADMYAPDDNRFDHRPFLYPNWKRQFDTIDELVKQDEKSKKPSNESKIIDDNTVTK